MRQNGPSEDSTVGCLIIILGRVIGLIHFLGMNRDKGYAQISNLSKQAVQACLIHISSDRGDAILKSHAHPWKPVSPSVIQAVFYLNHVMAFIDSHHLVLSLKSPPAEGIFPIFQLESSFCFLLKPPDTD